MEQHYQHTSSVDYSLKEGETLVLQIKNVSSWCLTLLDLIASYTWVDWFTCYIIIQI